MEDIKDTKKTSFWIWIIVAIIIVFLIYLGFWKLNEIWFPIPKNAAEFGDSFGGINALFSALAFAFLIVTALMQKKELQYQREELIQTRKELSRTASAQENSFEISKSQMLEHKHDRNFQINSDMFNELKQDISNVSLGEFKGIDAIDQFLKLHARYHNAQNKKVLLAKDYFNRELLYILKHYELLQLSLLEVDMDTSRQKVISYLVLSFYRTHLLTTEEYIMVWIEQTLKVEKFGKIKFFQDHYELLKRIRTKNREIEKHVEFNFIRGGDSLLAKG